MINRLSDSKYFNYANKKHDFSKVFSKLNWNEYTIPDEFIMDKVNTLKSFKYPLVDEIIKAVKAKKLILVDLNESPYAYNKMGNIHSNYKFPRCIFNLQGFDEDSEIVVYVDLSYKGKYLKATKDEYAYYDIPDITLFHMLCAGYIQWKLVKDPELSLNPDLYSKISEAYTLIMTKVIDNMFPIISMNSTGASKLHFLVMCFCMQNMFGINKETAIKQAMKSKFVVDKNGVLNETKYIINTEDFMNVDFNTKFPLDKFCEIICDEFEHIDAKVFTADMLHWKYNDRMSKSAIFCLDCGVSFINMIYFGKNGLGIYNDLIIKQYLGIASGDIVKDIVQIIKDK